MIPRPPTIFSAFSHRGYWILPALLGAALYLVNLPGTWIYDDLYFAHDDPRLHSVHHWGEYLTQEYFDGSADKLWRPLVSLSYAVEWAIHGDRPWPFHLVNLLLHAGVCALAAGLARRLLRSNSAALIAGLLFAAHPIHVEAVTGIVGRAEEMCSLGVLAALLLVVNRTLTVRRAFAVTACFLFAALSKEQGILLPLMLLGWALLARFENPSSAAPASDRRAGQWLFLLLTTTLAIYISYRNSIAKWYWDKAFLEWTINPVVRSVGRDRLLIPVAILGRYTALLIAPWRLAPDYSANVFTPVQHLNDPYLWIGVVAAIAWLIAISAAARRRDRTMMFLLGCLAITYFLASNILLIGTVFGERLMYLPSVFGCIIAARAIVQVSSRPRAIIVGLVLLGFCVRTETYAWQWNDRLRFYQYAAEIQPQSAQVFLLLGDELQRRGDLAGAEHTFALGRERIPGSWRMLDLSARLALLRGDYANAYAWARQAFHLHRGMDSAHLVTEAVEKLYPATQPAP
jgi:hypothetical protein